MIKSPRPAARFSISCFTCAAENLHFLLVAALEQEQGDAADGGIFQLPAEFDFLFVEAGEVVAAGELDGGMKGGEGLDEDFALDVAAPGAARHLGQQLKGPLARAEIGQVQAEVGVDDADQRDVGKVQALGDHLGADQDVGLAGAEIAQDAAVILLALEGVGVHPLHAGAGNSLARVASTFSVPMPAKRMAGLRHLGLGQTAGAGASWSQMWQRRSPAWRW